MDPINYLAILIAALGSMVVGYLWYGPLFGKYWRELKGYTPETMKETSVRTIAFSGVCSLVTAFVLALFVQYLNPIDVGGAFMLALLAWAGFVVTTHANYVLYEERNVKLYALNLAHHFAAILVASLVITLWP